MIDLEIISTALFFASVTALLIIDRKNIEFQYGLIIRRWKGGEKAIDRFVKKHRRVIRLIGSVAVVVAVATSLFGLYLLVKLTLSLERAFGLVLPTVAGVEYPAPIVPIPFWYWLIGVFIIIGSHETMHAIFSRLERIPIKSYGILFFLPLPIGAFVDPDMKRVAKLGLVKRLRIFASGSFGNLVVAALIFLFAFASTNASGYMIEDIGVKFNNTIVGTPAEATDLKGMIYQINDRPIKNRIDFIDMLNQTKPGDNITVMTTAGTFEIKTTKHPDIKGMAYMGVTGISEVYMYKIPGLGIVPDWVVDGMFIWFRLLFWLFVLSLGVGIANLLPMKPFDGGYIFEEIFKLVFKKRGRVVTEITSVVIASLILVNMFGINLIGAFA